MDRTQRLLLLPVVLLLGASCNSSTTEADEAFSLTPVWVKMGDEDGVIDTFVDRPTSVESAEYSPGDSLIASVAKGDDSVRLWKAMDGQLVWTKYAEDETEAVTFTRDGNYVLTGGEDRKVRAWRVDDGEIVKTLGHVASIEGLRVSPDGTMLATGNEAGELNIWDVSAPDPADWPDDPLYTFIHAPDQDHPSGGSGHADINQVDWTSDGRFVVSASRSETVKLWDVEAANGGAREAVQRYPGHTGSIKSVRLSPDNTLVAAGAQESPDGAARVWDVESGELVAELLFPNLRIVEAVAFTPDGRHLVVGGTEHRSEGKGTIYVFDVGSFGTENPEPILTLPVFNQEYFDFSADGSRLLSSHQDGSLRVWNVEQ